MFGELCWQSYSYSRCCIFAMLKIISRCQFVYIMCFIKSHIHFSFLVKQYCSVIVSIKISLVVSTIMSQS